MRAQIIVIANTIIIIMMILIVRKGGLVKGGLATYAFPSCNCNTLGSVFNVQIENMPGEISEAELQKGFLGDEA